ncbi:acyltransferase [Dysgonomonas sp. 25]|uniref:acyltransferase n=1 Tax=Dysgonomonas sp. 25 TaxID=2302933 RepID=UPI0013D5AA73|nr:acyltransferase [Dysgonomonas sp. 25]NDV68231.1 acyltransferase [Dysgonomonas sp. 25]
MTTLSPPRERIVFLDYLRVFACFMVIVVHACEFFYIGENSSISIAPGDGLWVSYIDGAMRAAVPLFIMTSSYLLLPLKVSPGQFYRRRFVRVLVPFIVWLLMYACLPAVWGDFTGDDVVANLKRLIFNFTDNAGHLWYVYMLIGIYLFMPILSPWLEKTSRKFELTVLLIWFATTFYHYVKLISPEYIFGEALWNEFSSIYYFSGYIGYVILAHYIREHINWPAAKMRIVGIASFLIGYFATTEVFNHFMGNTEDIMMLEISWRFCTPNVALMAFGIFLVFKTFNAGKGTFYSWINDTSKLSYGMYLMHIFYLILMYNLVHEHLSTPLTIVVIAVSTFLLCYLTCKLISFLPKSKYIIG